MFELLNPPVAKPQDDPITFREQASVYLMFLAVAFSWTGAAIILDSQPHGLQVATLIGYSGAVFLYTFFRTRGVTTRYRLSVPYVRRQLPRLILIHCAYLLMLYVVAGWAFASSLPPLLVIVGGMIIGLSQVILSRTLLGRAKRETMTSVAVG